MTSCHPHYGLADETRHKILKDAEIYGIREAAKINSVGVASIYRWRKDITQRGNHEETDKSQRLATGRHAP